MAVNIGPKIGIDGEAQFRKEINNIIQQAKTLDSEMKTVTSSFDKNANSQEKLEEQTRVLNQQIDVQSKRVELLEKGLREAAKQYGEGATQTLKWEQAVNEAKTTLNNMKSRLSAMEEGVEDVTEELEDGGKAAFDFGDAFKANFLAGGLLEGVKSLAEGIGNLAEETQEYRKIMGTLEVSSERAGYTAEQTAQTYQQLYGVLGDDQTAATTVANLQAIGLEQGKLTELTNAAIGAWATYGDSIPIDSLAESVNETIKAGQVTGTFADVLNWAGTNEDEFNKKLEEAKSVTERTNIVLQELTKQGLDQAGKAWQENNKDIVEANKAAAEFQDTTAKLAKKFSPVSTSVQKGLNKILDAAIDLVDESDIEDFTELVEDIADVIAKDVMPVVKNLFDFIIDNKGFVITAMAGISTALAANKVADGLSNIKKGFQALTSPIGLASLAIGGVVGLFINMKNKADEAAAAAREPFIQARKEAEETLQAHLDQLQAASEAAMAELSQVDAVKMLADELFTLADASGRVDDSNRARAQFILDQLNNALGTEYEITGNVIKQYNELENSVYKAIEAKRMEILMSQAEENYKEALKNKTAAEQEYYETAQAFREMDMVYSAQKEEYDRLIAERESIRENTQLEEFARRNNERIIELEKYLDAETKNYEDLKARYESGEMNMIKYNQTMQLYSDAYVQMLEGNTEEALALLERQNNGFKTAESVATLSVAEQTRILNEQYEQALFALDDYRAKYEEGLYGYNEATLRALERAAEDARIESEKVGGNLINSISLALIAGKPNLEKATAAVIGAIPAVAKGVLKIHSPSKVFQEIGEFTVEGFNLGFMEEMKPTIRGIQHEFDTMIDIGTAAITSARPVAAGGTTYYSPQIQMTVNAAPGQNERAIAEAVMYRIEQEVQRKGSVW